MTTCFVIGPIGQEYAALGSPERLIWESSLEIYESVIRAACEFLGIEAVRADQISIAGDITDQIFRRLYESDLVIADISGANANVMYELGLRHSLNALTIQVSDMGSPLPFDVKAIRTIPINRTAFGLIEARKKLTAAIEEGLAGNVDMVSATRVWEALRGAVDGDLSPYLGDVSEVDVPDEADAEGYFELIIELGGSFQKVTTSIGSIGECLVTLNAETKTATQEMSELDAGADAKDRLNLMRRFATTLGGRAEEFDNLTADYEKDLHSLDGRVAPLLELMAEHEQIRSFEGSDAFMDAVTTLARGARESFSGLGAFAHSAGQLGVMSKMLRDPSKRIVKGVARMSETVNVIENWDAAVNRIRSLKQD